MTRGSVKEYAEAVGERYLKSGRKEKTLLLDEFVRLTGYHRRQRSGSSIAGTSCPQDAAGDGNGHTGWRQPQP